MTEEHRRKISESCKGKSKNKGKICINNGKEVKLIKESDFSQYEKMGFVRGRYYNEYQPWNKGLKASEDSRVAKMKRVAKK